MMQQTAPMWLSTLGSPSACQVRPTNIQRFSRDCGTGRASAVDESRPERWRAMAVAVGAAAFAQQRWRTSRLALRATAGADAAEQNVRVGMKVRVVAEGVKLFHVAKSNGVFNPKGLKGEIVEVLDHDHLTPNRPYRVKLEISPATPGGKTRRSITHFEFNELCFYSPNYQPCEEAEEASDTASASTIGVAAAGTLLPSAAAYSSPASSQKVARSAIGPSATLSVLERPSAAGTAFLEDSRWQINLLYDGECPSCMRQVEFLQKRMDENPEYFGLIRFTNLTHPAYNPQKSGGIVFEDGMHHLHAVMRDGEVVTGMEAFRRIYNAVGMEWVRMVTTLPVVGGICDWLYDLFAEYRSKNISNALRSFPMKNVMWSVRLTGMLDLQEQ